jgi:hypothetical protein
MKIMQGDSYPIPVDIMQDGVVITPEMVEDVEITVGAEIRKLYSTGGITFENDTWYFLLTQQETFSMSGSNEVICRLKYPVSGYTQGTRIGSLNVTETSQKWVM